MNTDVIETRRKRQDCANTKNPGAGRMRHLAISENSMRIAVAMAITGGLLALFAVLTGIGYFVSALWVLLECALVATALAMYQLVRNPKRAGADDVAVAYMVTSVVIAIAIKAALTL